MAVLKWSDIEKILSEENGVERGVMYVFNNGKMKKKIKIFKEGEGIFMQHSNMSFEEFIHNKKTTCYIPFLISICDFENNPELLIRRVIEHFDYINDFGVKTFIVKMLYLVYEEDPIRKMLESVLNQKFPPICPSGEFVAYKIAEYEKENVIVTLRIPTDAKRSNAFGRKCRCDKAFVERIELGDEDVQIAHSKFDYDFVYEVGKMVSVFDFDKNRFCECSSGIHFFLTKEEAIKYFS